jgi:uncharacterized protein (TIGR02996 family)
MVSEADLLQKILADPEDDAVRRAYAEALERRGDPRGEFIRAQLRIAELHAAQEDSDELARLEARERQLLRQHGQGWAGPIAAQVKRVTFRRGFPEQVELDTQEFIRRAPELYRLAPVLHLDLTGAAGVMRELAACPHLSRIASLNLWRNAIDDAGAQALAASPHLGRLTWLELGQNRIGAAGLEALFASPGLPSLRWLGFHNNLAPDPAERPEATDSGFITEWFVPKSGQELEARYGRRRWLHFNPQYSRWYPPNRMVVFRPSKTA